VPGGNVEKDLHMMLPAEKDAIMKAAHKPSFVCQVRPFSHPVLWHPSSSFSSMRMCMHWNLARSSSILPSFRPPAASIATNSSPFPHLSSHLLLLLVHPSVHPPLQVLSRLIRKTGIAPIYGAQMDLNITAFEDIIGGCERILRTPIPVSYTRHTSR
jgi:ion channel-forming bestrophin family protein